MLESLTIPTGTAGAIVLGLAAWAGKTLWDAAAKKVARWDQHVEECETHKAIETAELKKDVVHIKENQVLMNTTMNGVSDKLDQLLLRKATGEGK